jgi:hypothetical protein
MSKAEYEKSMMDFVLQDYDDYARLISFYHKEGALNVLKVKEDESTST